MTKTYKIRTLEGLPVYLPSGVKFIALEFNMDSQETELVVEIPDEKFLGDIYEV